MAKHPGPPPSAFSANRSQRLPPPVRHPTVHHSPSALNLAAGLAIATLSCFTKHNCHPPLRWSSPLLQHQLQLLPSHDTTALYESHLPSLTSPLPSNTREAGLRGDRSRIIILNDLRPNPEYHVSGLSIASPRSASRLDAPVPDTYLLPSTRTRDTSTTTMGQPYIRLDGADNVEPSSSSLAAPKTAHMATTTLHVGGMTFVALSWLPPNAHSH